MKAASSKPSARRLKNLHLFGCDVMATRKASSNSSSSSGSSESPPPSPTSAAPPTAPTQPTVVPAEYTAVQFPNIPHDLVNVELDVASWDQGELGNFVDIGDRKEILFVNSDARFANSKIIVGDRIIRIGAHDTEKLVIDDIQKLLHVEGKVKLTLLRRRGLAPVPPERLEALRITPSYGFTYALLTVVKPTGEVPRGNIFGYQGRVLNNKVYVCKVSSDMPAAQWLAPGDALLDLNGTPVPFNQTSFINQYWGQYKESGSFTAVIERPCTEEALEAINGLIASFFPPPQTDAIAMGVDAIAIGAQASKRHRTILRKIEPISVVKVASTPAVLPAHKASNPTAQLKRIEKKKQNATVDMSPTTAGTPPRRADKASKPPPTESSVRAKFRTSGRRLPSRAKKDDGQQTVVEKKANVTFWPRSVEYAIGTNVSEETKLKKVEKKNRAKKGILSFLDLF